MVALDRSFCDSNNQFASRLPTPALPRTMGDNSHYTSINNLMEPTSLQHHHSSSMLSLSATNANEAIARRGSTGGLPSSLPPSMDPSYHRIQSHISVAHRESNKCHEITLSAFASLLSSAHQSTVDDNHPHVFPKLEPALSKFFSPLVSFDNSNPCADNAICFPSLSLRNGMASSAEGMSLKDSAALNLALPFCVSSPQEIASIPRTLLESIKKSFGELLDSRLRSTIVALKRQSLVKLGMNGAGSREIKTICAVLKRSMKPVTLTTIVTSVRALNQSEKDEFDSGKKRSDYHSNLPLIFEAVFDAKVLGKLVTVSIRAPGMISGNFHPQDGLLDRLEVVFDTIVLLQEMMIQARVLAKKAVSLASGIASSVSLSGISSRHSLSKLASFSSMPDVAFLRKKKTVSFRDLTLKAERSTSLPICNESFSVVQTSEPDQSMSSTHEFPQHLQEIATMLNEEKAKETSRKRALAAAFSSTLPSDKEGAKPFQPNSLEGQKALAALGASIPLSPLDIGENFKNDEEQGKGDHELFSWIKNDDMFLKNNDSKSNDNDRQQEGHDAGGWSHQY